MPTDTGGHYVLLSLQSRTDGEPDPRYNRVALKAENISISTNKDVLALPIPFSGITGGEATKIALDFGVSTKTISVSGVITSQNIYKTFNILDTEYHDNLTTSLSPTISENNIIVNMGAHEVAQLIHSYVDSSFRQQHQNLDELIILIRSKVNKDYQYYSNSPTINEGSDIEDAKLIPFTYKVRDGDGGKLDGRQPYVEFSLDFEQATNPLG